MGASVATPLRILCAHGIGRITVDVTLRTRWQEAIIRSLQRADPAASAAIDFVDYDDLFEAAEARFANYANDIDELIGSRSGRVRDVPAHMRWTAGMIVQWSSDDRLRKRAADRVLKAMGRGDYDVVCAHGIGSLICYDAFAHDRDAIGDKVFATLGSQLANPLVRDVFAGYIRGLPARQWFNLFNPHDRVFTSPLAVPDARFTAVTTAFESPEGGLNHDADLYLSRPETIDTLWQAVQRTTPRAYTAAARAYAKATRAPDKRALLIGINEYPDPASRLEGCVNDVFLMSSLLQECGFEADDIRVVLDARATAAGILDRLHWLLDGVQADDQRVLYYSGHGAQMPAYGVAGKPDRVVEVLVPHDFDWSFDHAITDRQFCELYSQLPYDCHFVAIFDCCHSGGMTREGGAKVRGVTPPDDVRHRALRWDAVEKMWVERDFKSSNAVLAASKKGREFLGSNGATRRIGRGADLRTLPSRVYKQRRAALGHRGPYLPIIVEACAADQLSFEYRDGATSYGAFTYSLVQGLRASRDQRRVNLNYHDLLAATRAKLARLDYDQTPQLVGAKSVLDDTIPWSLAPLPATRARRTAKKIAT